MFYFHVVNSNKGAILKKKERKEKKFIFLAFIFPNYYGKLNQRPLGTFIGLYEKTGKMNQMYYLPRVIIPVYEDGSFETAHNHGSVEASFLLPFFKDKDRICDIVLYF